MRKLTEETKAKISVANIGRVQSPEIRARESIAQKGHPVSPETRAQLSAKSKGNKNALGTIRSDKYKEKVSKVHTGLKASAETRAKMSVAHMGNKSHSGLKDSLETRAKISASLRARHLAGPLAPNWKGGITAGYRAARTVVDYADWRTFVFVRDQFTCQKCEEIGGRLEAHHMDSFADFPEKQLELDNGITFCRDCHNEFNRRYGHWHNRKWQTVEFLTIADGRKGPL
jgi:hypothetical protein